MASKIGKEATAVAVAKLIAGIQQHPASFTNVTLSGGTFPEAQILTTLRRVVEMRAAVDAAKAALETAVRDENTSLPTLLPFVADVVAYVRVTFGENATALAHFGLTPKKVPTPQTVDEKAAAVAKREATREARHTMGPKARLAIHGDVVGVEVTPVVEPAETPAATQAASVAKAASKGA